MGAARSTGRLGAKPIHQGGEAKLMRRSMGDLTRGSGLESPRSLSPDRQDLAPQVSTLLNGMAEIFDLSLLAKKHAGHNESTEAASSHRSANRLTSSSSTTAGGTDPAAEPLEPTELLHEAERVIKILQEQKERLQGVLQGTPLTTPGGSLRLRSGAGQKAHSQSAARLDERMSETVASQPLHRFREPSPVLVQMAPYPVAPLVPGAVVVATPQSPRLAGSVVWTGRPLQAATAAVAATPVFVPIFTPRIAAVGSRPATPQERVTVQAVRLQTPLRGSSVNKAAVVSAPPTTWVWHPTQGHPSAPSTPRVVIRSSLPHPGTLGEGRAMLVCEASAV